MDTGFNCRSKQEPSEAPSFLPPAERGFKGRDTDYQLLTRVGDSLLGKRRAGPGFLGPDFHTGSALPIRGAWPGPEWRCR